jgi:hypothetical protein
MSERLRSCAIERAQRTVDVGFPMKDALAGIADEALTIPLSESNHYPHQPLGGQTVSGVRLRWGTT